MDAPAIAFVTLGCPKNEVDSDRMRAAVTASAYRLVEDVDDADVVVINTCAFIRPAVEEAVETVLEYSTVWRDERPNRRVIVAGCLPSRYGNELADAMPEADALVPVAEEARLLETIAAVTGVAPGTRGDWSARTGGAYSAYVQISDGCDRRCAFCTIPAIRGPHVSRPLDELLTEIEWLTAHGAAEIILVGQDTSSYGSDLGGDVDLARLVSEAAPLPHLKWLRLMYVQPDRVTDGLLEAMQAPNVCRYLDLPFQHASKAVLRAMGRRGDGAAHLGLITRIRAALPDVVLRTTLMTGFPGETRRDVDELVDFVERAEFDYAGVFAYSPEEGTRAASLDGLPESRTRIRRAQRVRDAADAVGMRRVERFVGRTMSVLSEGQDEEGLHVGRTAGQAPEVDGIVLLDRAVPAGRIVRVTMIEALGYDLVGEVVE